MSHKPGLSEPLKTKLVGALLFIVMIGGILLAFSNRDHYILAFVGVIIILVPALTGIVLLSRDDFQVTHLQADKLQVQPPQPHVKTTTPLGGQPEPQHDGSRFFRP